MSFTIPPEVITVVKMLKNKGFLAYLVGGCVRDLVMQKIPKDWDIATNATPEEIISVFPKTFYANDFGTVTVVNEDTLNEAVRHIEVTPFREETTYSDKRHPDQVTFGHNLSDDLKRRDFTINALAYDPTTGELVDQYDGQGDIKKKLVRAVGDPNERLNEDPLRIMRAIRIVVELGFGIESKTEAAIREHNKEIGHISVERIRDEFTRIIMSPRPLAGINMLNHIGILKFILPELEEGLHVKQNGDHIYDVWEHTLRVVQHSADRDWPLHVRLAALFHDIAKPRTRRFDEVKQDYTFYGHEVVGARLVKVIMNRLKFPSKITETVEKLVRNHMFFTDIDRITLSAVRRIVRNVGPDRVWDLMKVRACDRIGMGRPVEEPYRLRKYESMIEEALRAPTSVDMLKINGEQVMTMTKLPPGPKIGFILHALLEETLDNPDLNTEEYLEKRVGELAKLSDQELKKLGEQGKEKKVATEEKELGKIRSKYRVR